jgi:two-component system sensor histidine kinase HydH/two-component system sensor histidine kinase AtoS
VGVVSDAGFWTFLVAAIILGAAAGGAWRRFSEYLSRVRQRAGATKEQDLLDKLASGLAHELKNPLGALNLNVQLLEEELEGKGALGDSSRARLTTIKNECRRLEEVLNNFLRYAGRRQLALTDVDLNKMVDELVTFIKPESLQRGVALEAELSAEPLVVKADATLIKQAFLNVLLNGLEATSGKGTILIRTAREDGGVTVSVQDSGAGISSEDLPHIFDAYFSRKPHGMGLGLAITKRIIDDHGGRITVGSTPGEGTRVTVFMPSAVPGRPEP